MERQIIMIKKLSILLLTALFLSNVSLTYARSPENSSKKWTIMVYSNADNNLDADLVNDVIEMQRAGISESVNVVVEIDRLDKPARRYCVTERSNGGAPDDWGFSCKKLEELGEVDMGDMKELVKFVKWAHENYPAGKYMLIIQNHGYGWKKKKKSADFRGISYDDQSGHNLSNKELGSAMQMICTILGKRLDIFGTDACLMQMLEVNYEIKDFVNFTVASEENIPGPGWPYEMILAPLMKNPQINPKEFASMIPQAFCESYKNDLKNSTAMSSVDCSRVGELAEAVDLFAEAYIEAAADSAEIAVVKAALNGAQKFYDRTSVDIGHLMKRIIENSKNEKIIERARLVLMAYQKVVFENAVSGTATQNASGMAIYFPTYHFNTCYNTIKFSEFRWDEFLKLAHKMTQCYGDEMYDPTASDADGANGGWVSY